jgi:hypothetical protein
VRRRVKKWKLGTGIALALAGGVSETAEPLVFDEPTVMWRMERAGGLSAHAVLGPHLGGAILVWFINDRPAGYRRFTDWTDALQWSDQLQAQNWAVGWRLASE